MRTYSYNTSFIYIYISYLEYRLSDWGAWSSCSASCRLSQANPIRARARDYCLSNSSSSYQCTANFMINYEPCNTAACPIGNVCKIN